jgi:hypothetical protein
MSSKIKKVKLTESEFRKLVKEELLKEAAYRKLIKAGYDPTVANEILRLKNEGLWDDVKNAFRTGQAAVGTAKDTATNIVKAAGGNFTERYRKALAGDVQKAFKALQNKYGSEKVLNKAGLDKAVIDKLFEKSLSVLLYGVEEEVDDVEQELKKDLEDNKEEEKQPEDDVKDTEKKEDKEKEKK